MHELRQAIPDPSIIPLLPSEELASTILFILRKRMESNNGQPFLLYNELLTLWPQQHWPNQPSGWLQPTSELRDQVGQAMSEAWAWLTAQGLLVPSAKQHGADWQVLSRKARDFEDPAAFTRYRTARLLPKEILVPQLSTRVWLSFMRGDFDSAAFYTMKTVEVEVREASGLPHDFVGMALMRKAFDPQSGILTDKKSEKGEREARSALFAGAIGSYKNPQSHRDVNIEDPAEAMEIVLLANHLIRIVETRRKAMQP